MKRVSLVAVRHPHHEQLFLHGLRTDSGRWSLPGGHCKDGETPEEGARREFFEETGLTPRDISLVWQEVSPSSDDPEGVHVHLFQSTWDGGEPTPVNDPDREFVTYKWLDPMVHPNLAVTKDSNALVHFIYDSLGLVKREQPEGFERESELIREHRKKPENQRPHDFEAAEWTHPNGHPRCIRCGEEESTSGRCEGYDPAKRAAPGLAKGSRQRKIPFQPRHDVREGQAHEVKYWQDYTPESSDDDEDFALTTEEHMQPVREGLSRMHPNALARGLHRLASDTQSRINPKSGEREFLLHRGMSPDEHNASVGEGSITHSSSTSWTPDIEQAKKFPETGRRRVVSAWIPQSKIRHIPRMYGMVKPDENFEFQAGHGENPYSEEHEVIVGPHQSETVDMTKLPKPPRVHQVISEQGAQPGRIKTIEHYRRVNPAHPAAQVPVKSLWDKMHAELTGKPPKMGKSEGISKAERPPKFIGERHPKDPHKVGRFHEPSGLLSWHATPQAMQYWDEANAKLLPGFLAGIPESHRGIVEQAARQVMQDPMRHHVMGSDLHPSKGRISENQALRARHLNAVLKKLPHTQVDTSKPGQVTLTVARHRGSPEATRWVLTPGGSVKRGRSSFGRS